MNTFKIESGKPVPSYRKNKFPFGDMKIGDSFFVPGGAVQRISSAANGYAKYHANGIKFTTQKCTEEGVDGVRIWRIE